MTAPQLRIVFAGTPDFAAGHLQHLLAQGCNVVSAYSQPDRPSGRGKKLSPSPVKALALQHGIPVEQPLGFAAEALSTLASWHADVMIVVAYGLLLPPAVLALPRHGCINVHASLLPRWRGAAPIERAMLAGDAETGVSIMQMNAGLDTGPVLARASTPISDQDTAASLTARLQALGCQTLDSVLAQLLAGTTHAEPQTESDACYARKLNKAEAAIDWTRPASSIQRQVRAFFPRSPAYCLFHGQRVRIIQAKVLPESCSSADPGTIIRETAAGIVIACGSEALEVSQVQLEGKSATTIASLHNGHPDLLRTGQRLDSATP
jgi:methionyl-tRNA formyltransferase